MCTLAALSLPPNERDWEGVGGLLEWAEDRLCTGFKHKAKQGKRWAQHKLFPSCSDFTLDVMKLLLLHISRCLTILQVASLEKLIPIELDAVCNVQRCTRYKSGFNSPLASFPYENTETNPLFPIQTLFKWRTTMTGNESAVGNNNAWPTPALQLRKQQHLLCGSEGSQGPALPTPSQLCTSWIISWVLLPLLRPWRYPCLLWKLFMSSVQQCTD